MTLSVLITGANRGLGYEFARQYAAEGWRVHATCRDPASADDLERLAGASGGAVSVLALDVTDGDSIGHAAAGLGGEAIDLLLNSAGVGGSGKQSFGAIDYDAWAETLGVNTLGPMRVAEAFVDHVGGSQRKLMVAITSGMGSLADITSGGSVIYRSSKAALNMAMRTLALDLAPQGIRCVVVNPGWVRTDMGGANATLAPSESVGAIRDLIEALGPEQTGEFLNYDGNQYPW